MEADGAVTATVDDRGTMMVKLAPAGPVVITLQSAGEMKFSVVKSLAVKVTFVAA